MDVRGRVQGVGFRPAVVRVALEEGLVGLVGNDSQGAFIEVEGDLAVVARFPDALRAGLPPLAKVSDLETRQLEPLGAQRFEIVASEAAGERAVEIAPDVATCVDCARELADPKDRRLGYPFINCTNCGPRYSIIQGVPYDRPLTTMAKFPMCAACQAEYDDPMHRRYHAQPNACPDCGPAVQLVDAQGQQLSEDPIASTIQRLAAGEIVAVKGLGGFHLACDAGNAAAIAQLRRRKGRDAKPFAMMVPNLQAAAKLVQVTEAGAQALEDIARPHRAAPCPAAIRGLGPGDGLCRPGLSPRPMSRPSCATASSSPIPRCMSCSLQGSPYDALVMTSGNRSDEPLCWSNEQALEQLAGIADAWLIHDRDIARPIDDSVVFMGGPPRWRIERRTNPSAPRPRLRT